MRHSRILRCTASLVLVLAACADGGREDQAPAGDGPSAATATPAAAPATGRVIEIRAIADEQGNRFEPREIEAKSGDVLRLTLVSGVHNLSFPADKNPRATGLPEPSPMLQLPGQTHDIPVSFGPGEYTFQCDPHAALGMIGELEVED